MLHQHSIGGLAIRIFFSLIFQCCQCEINSHCNAFLEYIQFVFTGLFRQRVEIIASGRAIVYEYGLTTILELLDIPAGKFLVYFGALEHLAVAGETYTPWIAV